MLQYKIPVQPTQAIASYNYVDLVTGLGYQDFYPTLDAAASATDFPLNTSAMDSFGANNTVYLNATTSMTFTSSGFNLPRTVKGTAYFSCGFHVSSGTPTTNVTITVQKWDGTTATNLSSAITSANAPTGTARNSRGFIEIPLTQTTIKAGEKLRVVVAFSTSTNTGYIGLSPTGQTADLSADFDTTWVLRVPFKIPA